MCHHKTMTSQRVRFVSERVSPSQSKTDDCVFGLAAREKLRSLLAVLQCLYGSLQTGSEASSVTQKEMHYYLVN